MRLHRKITFSTSVLYPGDAEEVEGRDGYAGEEEDVPTGKISIPGRHYGTILSCRVFRIRK